MIVDTGSKDNTVEICKEYTDKVYFNGALTFIKKLLLKVPYFQKKWRYLWRDDYQYSRNISLSLCAADYVLIIDADEELTIDIAQLKKIINERWFEKYNAISFTVITAAETFDSPRIFKRCKEIYYQNSVHNVPTWNGSTGELQAKTYQTTFEIKSGYSPAHKNDPNRTIRMLKKDLRKNKKNVRNMYYLSKQYMDRDRIKEAVYWLEKYREIAFFDCNKWSNEVADALYLLALCYADQETYNYDKYWHKSVQAALESWTILPTSKEVARLLKCLFGETPGSTKEDVRTYSISYKFWEIIEKNAPDTGVMMKRNFNE